MIKYIGFLAIALLMLAVGCGEDPAPTPTPTPTPTPVAVTSVTLNQTLAELKVGETVILTAAVSPSNATDKTVTWSSSNSGVATVSGGTVKGVAEGTATITASAGGKSATCSVKVTPNVVAVTGITLNQKDIAIIVGDTFQLTATVSPDNATEKTVAWSSADEQIATVDNTGKVTAKAPGKTSIAARSGKFSAFCEVSVALSGGNEDFGYENLKK